MARSKDTILTTTPDLLNKKRHCCSTVADMVSLEDEQSQTAVDRNERMRSSDVSSSGLEFETRTREFEGKYSCLESSKL